MSARAPRRAIGRGRYHVAALRGWGLAGVWRSVGESGALRCSIYPAVLKVGALDHPVVTFALRPRRPVESSCGAETERTLATNHRARR